MNGGPVTAAPAQAPGRAPPEPARPAAEASPAAAEGGATFPVRLGAEAVDVPLTGPGAESDRQGWTIDVGALGLALPGVTLQTLRVTRAADGTPNGGQLRGTVSAPFVRGEVRLGIDVQGNVSGGVDATFDVEVLGRPQVRFDYTDRVWSGRLAIEGRDLRLPIPGVEIVDGSAVVTFRGADVTGTLTAHFRHPALGDASLEATIAPEGFSGRGSFAPTLPFLRGLSGTFALAPDGALSGALALTTAGVQLPIPGLALSSLSGNVAYANRAISGTMAFTAEYAGLARLTLTEAAFDNRGLSGARGSLEITAPPVAGSSGTFALDRQGRPSGELTLRSDQIPIPALRRGSLTLRLREDGGVDVSGAGRIELGPIGGGDFQVAWEEGILKLGTRATITVPPLQPVTLAVDVVDGRLSGEVLVPLALGPLSGNVTVRYRDEQFSGDGTLAYALGRFNGSVTVAIDNEGHVSGSGDAEFRIAPWLAGRIALTVHPDLNVDAVGELSLPGEIVLFDPWRFERNFFHFEQEFPLWGITIPVVGSIGLIASVHANAGFRASFGPGTLRNARATGEVSTRADAEPAFTVSGDFMIPAGAEVVITVGGGIGLAALIAKIEGGIDLQGIAGVYGAITLTPTFAYRDGQYRLSGSALLAAAAQLRARINAYARVVAGIGWLSGEVWRKDWNLAEWIFDSGWNVGLRAGIEYVVGEPFVPEVTLEPVEVDPTAIIRAAVPNSGEPVPAPPRPPIPQAAFTPAEGAPGAVGAAPAPGGGTAPPAPGATPAPGGPPAPPPAVPAAPGASSAPAGEQSRPRVTEPATASEAADERTVDETYLIYVYDSIQQLFARQRTPTAPADEELARREAQRRRAGRPAVRRRSARPGAPLTPDLRARMEGALGADLSDVRVHDDEAARESARALGAEAYTVGRDVFMGPSRTAGPGNAELVAHELTHAVQAEAPAGRPVGAAASLAEQEAEEAGKAVARGEAPPPIKKRREGEAHLQPTGQSPSPAAPAAPSAAPPQAGPQGGQGPAVQFTETQLAEILREGSRDPRFAQAVEQLLSKAQVSAQAKQEVWDHAGKKFAKRGPVPMRFPGPASLPRKSVMGTTQLFEGLVLRRHGEERTTDKERMQSKLSRLMYPSGQPPAQPEFTRHQQGTREPVTFAQVYAAYSRYQADNGLPAENDVAEDGVRALQSTRSAHNLRLTAQGARSLAMRVIGGVEQGPYFRFTGGRWERLLEEPASSSSPPAAGTAQPQPGDPAATAAEGAAAAIMVADYQAHHVIPLWLEAEAGPTSGDELVNLAPWYHGAHQTNHAYHHTTPESVRTVTGGVTDYRDFPNGTRFVVSEMAGGNAAHPQPPPPYALVNEQWKSQAPPPWWG